MQTISKYLDAAIRVRECLAHEKNYCAHIPSDGVGNVETLAEHLDIVFDYFVKLIEENGLNATIDNLINKVVSRFSFEVSAKAADHTKSLFVDTIVFHDFGKVNENFQADRMLNNLFKKVSTPIKPIHGHSELGAFIYLAYELEKLKTLSFSDEEMNFLAVITFILANSIALHHSPNLVEPLAKLKGSGFIRYYPELVKYLHQYHLEEPDLTVFYFQNLEPVIDSISFSLEQAFPLFALTKLNSSLLTAADYLATSEYMTQQKVGDLGLITESLMARVIKAARFSKPYNTKAYELAESNYEVNNPTDRSNFNLNILRQNMAVEVIRCVQTNFREYLFYLEAPTGGGKTNLSMLAVAELLKAHPEINKVFYVFPFTTLITQTHKAILEVLDLSEKEVSLLHSKAGFQTTEEDDEYGGMKLDYLNNLFVHYPFCLLTHIRFFDILKTNEKETNYLLHRIANSIVVIDELQSYPPRHWDKMLYFIQHYAHFFNVRFILMSATLPRIDKLKLPLANRIEFTDLLPNSKRYFTNQNFANRVQFKFDYREEKLTIEDLAAIVLEKSETYIKVNATESVFTIVEFIFKKSTTLFYEAVGGKFFDVVFVLSGTIVEPRRKEIINYLKNKVNRDKKVLLITTQVVEAGVDIDMDLGFKNISIIDSDEQLAGRVNRNVTKAPCEVYLFEIDKPSTLYKMDERYQITRDKLTKEDHQEILATKNFEKLYDLVLEQITKINGIEQIQNFNSDYLPEIARLNYKQIHHKFKLIDQENFSVFVPLKLPKIITSSENGEEAVFSNTELQFLLDMGVETYKDCIDGEDVWRTYKLILFNRKNDFVGQQINKKIISGILSKFTFSTFSSVTLRNKLVEYSIPHSDRDEDLRGFENYVYLARHDECYDYNKGLLESKFDASENLIL